MIATNDTINELLELLGAVPEGPLPAEHASGKYLRDLKLNLKGTLSSAHLSGKESMLLALGKEFFELISLAVSAVNGCEMCVRSHEQSLRALGASEERIFDAVRLASVMESLVKLF
jgi:AhpD family alkylhydroperoxidase